MKPALVIGVGNALMGDDGVGCVVARRLAADARLPAHVEVVEGGTDLLRLASRMEGRAWILIVDAIADGNPPGAIQVFRDHLPADSGPRHAHELSLIESIRLLRAVVGAPISLITISVGSALVGLGLSDELTGALDGVVDATLAFIQDPAVL